MKATVSSVEDLPEALRSEYEERDGKFYLKLEGDPHGYVKASELAEANSKLTKLTEFRDNNIGLKKQIDQLTAKYDGIDPEEHKALKAKIDELEKRGVKGGDDVATMVQKGVEIAVTPLKVKLQELEEENKQAKETLAKRDIESMLTKEALKAGVTESAMSDYLRRGLEVFRMDDGKPLAMNGETPLFCKENPAKPLTIEEWVAGLSDEAPHLFKPSKGGGAEPGPGGPKDPSTYDRNNDQDFLGNLEDIAKGKMQPRMP